MSFEKVIGPIVKAEGGYTNHEADNGGPTNYGITQATLQAYRGRKVSIDEVKELTLDEAIRIYKKRYWDPMGLDRIKDEQIQLVMFDQGVNRGTKTAVLQAQRTASAMGKKLTADGDFGPVSAAAINSLPATDFIREFLQASEHAYADICIRNNSQLVFFHGWLNRVHNLQDKIFTFKEVILTPIEKVKDVEAVVTGPADYFNAAWVGANIDLLGRNETDPVLQARYVPEWRLEGLPGYKSLSGKTFAWCSLRENADKRKVGIKGTNSAAAASWSKWGMKCPYWFGATLDIRHASGGRHVGNFLYWIDEKKMIAAVLGGNQSNQFSVAATNLSGNSKGHDECVTGPRWPEGHPVGMTVSKEEVLKRYPFLKVGGSMKSTT